MRGEGLWAGEERRSGRFDFDFLEDRQAIGRWKIGRSICSSAMIMVRSKGEEGGGGEE